MVMIHRIMYASKTINLLDNKGGIQKRFTYDEWQKWLRSNGAVNIPFIYNNKTEEAQRIQ